MKQLRVTTVALFHGKDKTSLGHCDGQVSARNCQWSILELNGRE
jgi:hypothetical protein